MGKLKAVFFDLDGTLSNSIPVVCEALQKTMLERNFVQPLEYFRQFAGPPLSHSFTVMGVAQVDIANCIDRYHYFYDQSKQSVTLFAGVKELLAELAHTDLAIMLATSKHIDLAQKVCADFQITPYFTGICGAHFDNNKSAKSLVIAEALNTLHSSGVLVAGASSDYGEPLENITSYRDDVIMVGDRIYDIEGAKAHRIRTVLVEWGAPQKEWKLAWDTVKDPAALFTFLNEL